MARDVREPPGRPAGAARSSRAPSGVASGYPGGRRAGLVEHRRDRRRLDRESPNPVSQGLEPFVGKTSGAGLDHGRIDRRTPLEIVSHIPRDGVISGDGVAEDWPDFHGGAIARIVPADRFLRPDRAGRSIPPPGSCRPIDSSALIVPAGSDR